MEISKLQEKNIHQRNNKIKHHVKKIILPQKKGLFPKQCAFSATASRRRSGEKYKFYQPLNVAFNRDPLNLSALCEKGGTTPPEIISPILDRSQNFEPVIIHTSDVHDPLNLNSVGEEFLKPVRKRKKRKRKNTVTANDTDEVMNSFDSTISNKSLDSNNLIPAEQVIKASEKLLPIIVKENRNQKMNDDADDHKNRLKYYKISNYKFNEKNKRYRYGNFLDHNDSFKKNMVDQRLNFLKKDWFEGKQCLDIGCNTGRVTTLIAKHFTPSKIVGVDIDSNLIKIAKSKIQQFAVDNKTLYKFPLSFHVTYGPILGRQLVNRCADHFPDNLSFYVENYVPNSFDLLQLEEPKYDVILCLNVTKWVHLNFGDVGLKLFFKKIFLQLKPGGRLLLQPQTYNSYKKKKKITPETWKHFLEIKFMPTDFVSYLLSSEVGFARSECLTYSRDGKTGYDRPLYLLVKSCSQEVEDSPS